jgi:hypothetical protein
MLRMIKRDRKEKNVMGDVQKKGKRGSNSISIKIRIGYKSNCNFIRRIGCKFNLYILKARWGI